VGGSPDSGLHAHKYRIRWQGAGVANPVSLYKCVQNYYGQEQRKSIDC